MEGVLRPVFMTLIVAISFELFDLKLFYHKYGYMKFKALEGLCHRAADKTQVYLDLM